MAGSFLPDASCMIPFVCSWHENHDRATAEVQYRVKQREKLVVAAPALVETYSVLTRLPPPYRLSATVAWTLVESNFVKSVRTISLDSKTYLDLLRDAAARGVAGGRVYDEVIATCAAKARVNTVLTFNPRHFALVDKIKIVVPGAN